jgi:protein TonB
MYYNAIYNMRARYIVSTGLGVLVVFALLFVMQLLISTERGVMTDTRTFRIVDFVRVERQSAVETKRERPKKMTKPEQAPEITNQDTLDSLDNSMAVSVASPEIRVPLNIGGVGFGVSDGEYLPIVKVAPIYPARALLRDLEGYVILEFTVTRAGTVRNVIVMESTDRIFEQAAINAAYKFKYKPRVIDGVTVEVTGVMNKISFVIETGNSYGY